MVVNGHRRIHILSGSVFRRGLSRAQHCQHPREGDRGGTTAQENKEKTNWVPRPVLNKTPCGEHQHCTPGLLQLTILGSTKMLCKPTGEAARAHAGSRGDLLLHVEDVSKASCLSLILALQPL